MMINMINIMINSHLHYYDQHELQLDITVARDFATYTALKSNSQVQVTGLVQSSKFIHMTTSSCKPFYNIIGLDLKDRCTSDIFRS